jgi:hypothetical protein
MTVASQPARPDWPVAPMIPAAIVAVLIAAGAFLALRPHHVSLPFHGAKAAAFVRRHGDAFDRITAVRCGGDTCTVWLRPADPLPGAREGYLDLGPDIFMTANLGAPYGAVAAHHWRYRLVTRAGVIAAACTTVQAATLAGRSISPQRVRRVCAAHLLPST